MAACSFAIKISQVKEGGSQKRLSRNISAFIILHYPCKLMPSLDMSNLLQRRHKLHKVVCLKQSYCSYLEEGSVLTSMMCRVPRFNTPSLQIKCRRNFMEYKTLEGVKNMLIERASWLFTTLNFHFLLLCTPKSRSPTPKKCPKNPKETCLHINPQGSTTFKKKKTSKKPEFLQI